MKLGNESKVHQTFAIVFINVLFFSMAGHAQFGVPANSLDQLSRQSNFVLKDYSGKQRIYVLTSLPTQLTQDSHFQQSFDDAIEKLKIVLDSLNALDLRGFKPYEALIRGYVRRMQHLTHREYSTAILEALRQVILKKDGGAAQALIPVLTTLSQLIRLDLPWIYLQPDLSLPPLERAVRLAQRREQLIAIFEAPLGPLREVVEIEASNIRNVWHKNFIEGQGSPYPSVRKMVEWILGGYEDLFDFVILDYAKASDLAFALHDPLAVSVIWVAHASTEELFSGMAPEHISDWRKNDVKDLFRDVHPNIRFLGIVGCMTAGIIEKFRSRGSYDQNPTLLVWSEKGEVAPQESTVGSLESASAIIKTDFALIKSTLRERSEDDFKTRISIHPRFHKTYQVYSDSNGLTKKIRCPEKNDRRLAIAIRRSPRTTDKMVEVGIKFYDRLVGVLPASSWEQETVFYLNREAFENAKSQTISAVAFEEAKNGEIGDLSISVVGHPDKDWRLKLTKAGSPLGAPLAQLYNPVSFVGWEQSSEYWPQGCVDESRNPVLAQ